MISISKKIEYALIFVTYLSKKQGESISLSEASKVLKLPQRFLAQIAVKLKSNGIVESKEGKSGGYCVTSAYNNFTVFDLIHALDEDRGLVECLEDGKKCTHGKACKMRNFWEKIETNLVRELKKIRLNEV